MGNSTKPVTNSVTIVAYGEALWDLLPSGPVLGGAPLNFAYRINSLGYRGVMISKLGNDAFGDPMIPASGTTQLAAVQTVHVAVA